jgi:transcription elongation factor Elf1
MSYNHNELSKQEFICPFCNTGKLVHLWSTSKISDILHHWTCKTCGGWIFGKEQLDFYIESNKNERG